MGVFAAPDNTFNSPIKRSGKSTIGAATTGSNVGIENTRAVRGDHHNTDMTSKARLNSSFGGFAVSPNGSSSSLKYAQPDSPVKRAKSMFESKKIKSNDKTRSPLKRTQSESSTFSANNLKTTSSAFKKDKMSAMPNLHSSFSGLPPPSPTKAKSSKSKSSTSKEKARGVSFAPTPPSSTAVSGPDPSIAPWCIKKRLMLRYESPSKRQRKACTKIQAVVRGRRARELAYHRKLQRQLATMGQRTKTEKKQIQQDLEAKKARVLEKARSRSTRQAAKPQPVAATNRQTIDELKATNASIREQNKKLSTNCKNLRINNTRLAENQANMKGNRAALEAHHLQLMSDHDKLSRMEKDYIKKVTEHQESYDARHLSAQAEYNARAMYERLIARFTEMVKQCDNADVLLNEIEEHVDVLMAHKRNWITSPFEAETSPKPKPRKSRYAPPSDDEGDQVVSSPPIATKKGAAKTAAAASPKKTPASPAKKPRIRSVHLKRPRIRQVRVKRVKIRRVRTRRAKTRPVLPRSVRTRAAAVPPRRKKTQKAVQARKRRRG